MFRLFCLWLLASTAMAAEEIVTPAGVFELPEGFLAPSDAHQGPGGWSKSFVREREVLPRAVFTLTVVPLAETHGVEARVAAAQLADPMMRTPDGRPARRARVGGERGWRHSTTMRTGMVITAYAVDRDGNRLLAQLRYPGGPDYRLDAQRFERALQAFRWTTPAEAAEDE